MPKLKMSDTEKQNRMFKATIIRNMELYGIDECQIAKVMGKTKRTVQNKINNPSSCTTDDIRIFIKMLKMTDNQVIDLLGIRI